MLTRLIRKKITAVYYIVDALCKEGDRLSDSERREAFEAIVEAVDFARCPYVFQIPVLRLCGSVYFENREMVNRFFDALRSDYNTVALREVLMTCGTLLDRTMLRKMCRERFPTLPVEVQRALVVTLKRTRAMYDDEKRPLLSYIKNATSDRVTHAILAADFSAC